MRRMRLFFSVPINNRLGGIAWILTRYWKKTTYWHCLEWKWDYILFRYFLHKEKRSNNTRQLRILDQKNIGPCFPSSQIFFRFTKITRNVMKKNKLFFRWCLFVFFLFLQLWFILQPPSLIMLFTPRSFYILMVRGHSTLTSRLIKCLKQKFFFFLLVWRPHGDLTLILNQAIRFILMRHRTEYKESK